MKRLAIAFLISFSVSAASAQCIDTLYQYIDRASGLVGFFGIQGESGWVNGTNSITREVGNNYDFGNGRVIGAYIWFIGKTVVGTADSFAVSIYNTRAQDSLPTGAALGSKKISVDDIDTSGVFDDINFVQFDTPIPVTGRFALAVQVGSVPGQLDDTVAIVVNQSGDGLGERRAIMRAINNAWLHLDEVWVGPSGALDVDFMMFPLVEIDLSAVASIVPSGTVNACPGQTISLVGNFFTCTDNITLNWTGPGVNNPFNEFTTATIPSSASGNISYTLEVTDLDNNQTVTSNTVTVNVRAVNIDAGADTSISCNSVITLSPTVTGVTGAGTAFLWNNAVTSLTNPDVGPGTYSVTVTNSFGCTSSDAITVSLAGVNQALNFTINAANNIGCANTAISFTNTSTGLSNWNWQWNFGDGSGLTSGAQDPSYTYTFTGSFPVTLSADSAGCTVASVTKTITIQTCVGIESVLSSQIEMFPNPTTGLVYLNFSEVGNKQGIINIYDIRGAVVLSESVNTVENSQKTLNISNLSDGVYFVRIQLGEEMAMKKIHLNR